MAADVQRSRSHGQAGESPNGVLMNARYLLDLMDGPFIVKLRISISDPSYVYASGVLWVEKEGERECHRERESHR